MKTVFILCLALACLSITVGIIFQDAVIAITGIGAAALASVPEMINQSPNQCQQTDSSVDQG